MILDLASGKYDTQILNIPGNVVVHVDRCFGAGFGKSIDETAKIVEAFYNNTENQTKIKDITYNIFCKSDIFEFLDNFPIKAFDHINCNRFFEHLEYCSGEIGRMIEACNVITKHDATMNFVVPNHKKLAEMILQSEHSDNDVMVINTEFCNIRFDPHLSIWTPEFAKRYIESEATWKIDHIDENYNFAGRSIYMKVNCTKVNLNPDDSNKNDVDENGEPLPF